LLLSAVEEEIIIELWLFTLSRNPITQDSIIYGMLAALCKWISLGSLILLETIFVGLCNLLTRQLSISPDSVVQVIKKISPHNTCNILATRLKLCIFFKVNVLKYYKTTDSFDWKLLLLIQV